MAVQWRAARAAFVRGRKTAGTGRRTREGCDKDRANREQETGRSACVDGRDGDSCEGRRPEGNEVMYAIGGLGVLALGLIAFAICKRDSVKASLKFWKIDF